MRGKEEPVLKEKKKKKKKPERCRTLMRPCCPSSVLSMRRKRVSFQLRNGLCFIGTVDSPNPLFDVFNSLLFFLFFFLFFFKNK